MENSILLNYISKKALEVYAKGRVFDDLYWPNFFPWKYTPTLTVDTLIGAKGNRVAADVVTFDSPAPQKKRKALDSLHIEIPPIRVKRKMSESDLNTFFQLMSMASDEAQRQAINMVFDDMDFVVDAVNARLEWLSLQLLAHGTITLGSDVNVGPITGEIDYKLPDANKEYIGSAGGTAAATHYWTAAVYNTNDPITDMRSIVREAKGYGVNLRYLLMNESKWADLQLSDAMQNFCRAFVIDGTAYRTVPSLSVANSALKAEGLPQIVVVDTRVTIENEDHTQTSTDPWLHTNDAYVTFLEDLQVGDMLWTPTAEEQAPPKQAIHNKIGPILTSKFSETDPVAEFTLGLVNAFPSWPTIDRAWILNTESHTTF